MDLWFFLQFLSNKKNKNRCFYSSNKSSINYSLFNGNIFNRLITNNNSINATFNSANRDLMLHLF